MHIDGIQSSATISDKSEPESNGIERVLYIPQSSRTGASTLYRFVSYQGY